MQHNLLPEQSLLFLINTVLLERNEFSVICTSRLVVIKCALICSSTKQHLRCQKRYHMDQSITRSLRYHASVCQLQALSALAVNQRTACQFKHKTVVVMLKVISTTKSSFYRKCDSYQPQFLIVNINLLSLSFKFVYVYVSVPKCMQSTMCVHDPLNVRREG